MALCSPLCPCSSDCISSLYCIILHLLEQKKRFDFDLDFGDNPDPLGLGLGLGLELGLRLRRLGGGTAMLRTGGCVLPRFRLIVTICDISDVDGGYALY